MTESGGAGEARTPDLRFRNLIDIPYRVCFQSVQFAHGPALRFEQFKTVQLDLSGVEWVGQAFADDAHSEVQIEIVNANEDVDKMIQRAKA